LGQRFRREPDKEAFAKLLNSREPFGILPESGPVHGETDVFQIFIGYPNARSLLITADGGGSNGSRVRLWKIELQKLADELGVPITVCHLPPGTSKWNKIEHRLFSFITGNWRGKPLVSHQVIVQLIAATTTKTGLKVRCELDQNTYPAGIKVSDAEMGDLNLTRHDFHGEWNYTVSPKALDRER
jgi:hypothetical protein